MNRLLIIGASGHGKVVADIAAHCGYKDIAFLDDDTLIKSCMKYPVVGVLSDAEKYIDADFFVAIGNPNVREKVQEKLAGMNIVSLVHPDAVIAPDVIIGKGTAVMAGVVINPETSIGDGCIINAGATVDHDNKIENFVHVSVGSHLAGTVTVGRSTWIGAGTVVSNNVNICGGCMVGAGAVVVKDISEPGTYVGVPAKLIGDKEMKYAENYFECSSKCRQSEKPK
ncbi:MAG: acetyltransferase [Lachnospiraceae bacterium]|nr:acetyltransferase [Lachnospiraceae bacterium]